MITGAITPPRPASPSRPPVGLSLRRNHEEQQSVRRVGAAAGLIADTFSDGWDTGAGMGMGWEQTSGRYERKNGTWNVR